ncbi:NitT/TauT family transport system permease protein [Streptosporangium becharense]|uniref:NitT/TauT family transport system permease protein n=1 Tax=Streptosporangium becharense TaxID=1816182 RepID=A0A7W9IEF1_9ACTN|nr:ABC transporter permease [Streptosporangium becharense]MBB2910044.1 NitT/TauT family transport system permease protein [Streptosporangium becharense]MBB5819001.1 NitT/TauT family transport system permease protein [Streptosporangium becharense]
MTGRDLLGNRLLCGAVGVAGLFCLLEASGRTGFIDPDAFPLPSTVLSRAVLMTNDGEFVADIASTMVVWAVGLLIATVVGVCAGFLLGTVPFMERSFRPIMEFLRPVPSVALIPLALSLFSDKFDMKVTVIVYAATWPILINTMYGLKDVDPLAKETLRSFGFGRSAVLWRVSLPSTAPFIATGVRLASAIALIVGISAELLGGGLDGIGSYVLQSSTGLNAMEYIVAAALWAGVIGLVTNGLFVLAERRAFRWHTARTEVV